MVQSLRQLKTWVCSGETLPCSLAEEFFDWSETNGGSHILCNFYGSTEIMGDVTFHVMKNKQHIGDKGKVPIGMFKCNKQSLIITMLHFDNK